MTLVNKPYLIIDITEIKASPLKPNLAIYKITAVLGDWIAKSYHGRKLLKDKGYEEFMDKLEDEYKKTAECFVATVPATAQTLEWNKFHVGGYINIAYFPQSVKISSEVIEE